MYEDCNLELSVNYIELQEIYRIRKIVNRILSSKALTLDINRALIVVDELSKNSYISCYAVLSTIYERLYRRDGLYLSLELLEFCVKNCGLNLASYINTNFLKAMKRLLKLKSLDEQTFSGQVNSTIRSIVDISKRSLFKTEKNNIKKKPIILDTNDAILIRCQKKVLYLIQLWADAFILYEDRVSSIIKAYRDLKNKGYQFPNHDRKELFLIKDGEKSPVLNSLSDPSNNESYSSSKYNTSFNFKSRIQPKSICEIHSLNQNQNQNVTNRTLKTHDSVGMESLNTFDDIQFNNNIKQCSLSEIAPTEIPLLPLPSELVINVNNKPVIPTESTNSSSHTNNPNCFSFTKADSTMLDKTKSFIKDLF